MPDAAEQLLLGAPVEPSLAVKESEPREKGSTKA